jgi:hypothetical protein
MMSTILYQVSIKVYKKGVILEGNTMGVEKKNGFQHWESGIALFDTR